MTTAGHIVRRVCDRLRRGKAEPVFPLCFKRSALHRVDELKAPGEAGDAKRAVPIFAFLQHKLCMLRTLVLWTSMLDLKAVRWN